MNSKNPSTEGKKLKHVKSLMFLGFNANKNERNIGKLPSVRKTKLQLSSKAVKNSIKETYYSFGS